VFAPVWTALYVMMAVAAWRAWRIVGVMSVALSLYFLQLTLNFAWSLIFFSLHLIDVALIDIATLWIAILATTTAFFLIDRIAGVLMLPYLAWVSFASALNYEIWRLN
jgi:tryptophan-rich sensory protein